MLITLEAIQKVLLENNIEATGAMHIGAHLCEEQEFYNKIGISNENIVWLEALPFKVEENLARGVLNVYNAVVTDKDDDDVEFNVSNNHQSSSVLELGTHKNVHPDIHYIDKISLKTITIDTFFERNKLDASKYSYWNFDIQGAEFMALKGGVNSIKHAKAIYLEINEQELYVNCGLVTEIDRFLEERNFKRVLTEMTPWGWGDALYVLQENKKNEQE